MSLAYHKMKQLGITDVKTFNDFGLTVRPIALDYLTELLNSRGMLRKTDGSAGDERWKGTLQNMKAALVGLGLAGDVSEYEMWFSHITDPRMVKWDTTIPAFAAGFSKMKRNFADKPGMPTTADFDEIAKLGGGFLSITQQEYDDLKKAEEDTEKQGLIEQRIINATALARERIGIDDTPEQQAAKWNQAWIDAEA